MQASPQSVTRHPVVQLGARFGYVVSGLLHILIGLLAVRLATGDTGAEADQSGAFSALARNQFGGVILVAVFLGLGLLAVENVGQAFVLPETKDKVKAAAKGLGYLSLATAALTFLLGVRVSSKEQSQAATRTLLSLPAGVGVVVAVGLVVLGIAGYHVVKGATRRFRRDLTQEPPQGIVRLGVVGYIAKGVALASLGVLFVQAAVTHDPSRAGGLDAAITALLAVPLGQVLVILVALGFAAFGVYSFARARWARS